jgi:hypothetical protein
VYIAIFTKRKTLVQAAVGASWGLSIFKFGRGEYKNWKGSRGILWGCRRIYCGGHSLGSFMTVLCAAYMRWLVPTANITTILSGTGVWMYCPPFSRGSGRDVKQEGGQSCLDPTPAKQSLMFSEMKFMKIQEKIR